MTRSSPKFKKLNSELIHQLEFCKREVKLLKILSCSISCLILIEKQFGHRRNPTFYLFIFFFRKAAVFFHFKNLEGKEMRPGLDLAEAE